MNNFRYFCVSRIYIKRTQYYECPHRRDYACEWHTSDGRDSLKMGQSYRVFVEATNALSKAKTGTQIFSVTANIGIHVKLCSPTITNTGSHQPSGSGQPSVVLAFYNCRGLYPTGGYPLMSSWG